MFAKNEAKRAKEKSFYPFSFFLSIFSFFLFVFCFLPRLFLPYVAFPRMSRERDSHLTTVLHRGGGTQLYGSGYPGRIVHTLCFVCLGSGYFFYRPTSSFLTSFFFFLSKEEPGEKVSLGCRKKQSRSHLGTSDTFASLSHSRRE